VAATLDGLHGSGYGFDFYVDGEVGLLPEYPTQVFTLRQNANVCLSVWAGDVRINVHFFSVEEIEFDLIPVRLTRRRYLTCSDFCAS
jgi:hypothetical protein